MPEPGQNNQVLKEKEEEPPKATIGQMYQYISGPYKILMIFGIISAVTAGAGLPASQLVFREFMDSIGQTHSTKYMVDKIRDCSTWLIIICGATLVLAYIYFAFFLMVGQRVVYEFKWRYLKGILLQDTRWFDKNNAQELPSRMNADLCGIESASGKTIITIVYCSSTSVIGFGVAFGIGWLLAFAIFIIAPMICFAGGIQVQVAEKGFLEAEEAYQASGGMAEQALNGIKVVKAFGQENRERQNYIKHLEVAEARGLKYKLHYALAMGFLDFIVYFAHPLHWIVAGTFIIEKVTNDNADREYSSGDSISILWCIYTGVFLMGNSALNLKLLNQGLICTYNALQVIENEPRIELNEEGADPINKIEDDIKFDKVIFRYEGRNKNALNKVSFTIERNKTTALVGHSGSGKSTIVKLLERFYDPDEGQVTVNGKNLKSFTLSDYRKIVGYVGQEPCLFDESIKDNLLKGNPHASDIDIERENNLNFKKVTINGGQEKSFSQKHIHYQPIPIS
jgi:ATP-binding cassette subfamily B (MDR/TAP) protein 1